MRKLILLTGLLSLCLLFSACAREVPAPPIPRPILTTDQYLQDLDHMLYVMQNNFALFDVAYWARGVCIYTIIETIREAVLAEPDICVDEFYELFIYQFAPLDLIGHFMILSPGQHNFILNEPEGRGRMGFSTRALTRLLEAHVMAFYVPIYPTEPVRPRHLEGTSLDDITTRIIEEEHIAYLAIETLFMPLMPELEEKIFGFYEKVRDFNHLIIDFRDNGGGQPVWFYEMVLEPNISETFVIDGFSFLPHSEYTAQYLNIHGGMPDARYVRVPVKVDTRHRTVAEMLETYDLPDLKLSDMERMDYGFRVQTIVNPRFDYPLFTGKIWLLINYNIGSAAEIAVRIAQEVGFATLVGEITGGAYGGARTIFNLPNSGIAIQMDLNYVTDSRGRPFEAGTIPDIFNFEGMDALETALALIKVKATQNTP